MIPVSERYPSLTGSTPERLRQLNDRIKAGGWRGLAVWLVAETSANLDAGEDEIRAYYAERARWSCESGITYWKVDWGEKAVDPVFRRIVTETARAEFPELLIEHVRNIGPLNDVPPPWDWITPSGQDRFSAWGSIMNESLEIMSFSDVFRTYDVTLQLSAATTIDRTASLFAHASMEPMAKGILNCEDEVYLGAALGCAVGVMRANIPNAMSPNDQRAVDQKNDEVVRAVRWYRIAPAFGAAESETFLSDRILTDEWLFAKDDTWAQWTIGREYKQKAPAVVSRGIKLPVISCDGEPPFVAASQNPNGACAIATLPRTIEKQIYTPKADILFEICRADKPVGIFGEYGSLTLQFDTCIGGRRIFVQDLAGDEAADITGQVALSGNKLELTGELIRKLGRNAASPGDLSDPGLVLSVL